MNFIREHFSYSGKQIWKILINNKNELLLEERDLEKKETYFSLFSIEKGKLIIKKIQVEEKYWVGIELFNNELIIFHKFAQPSMPLHKGIFVYDISSQKIIWQNEDFSFLKLEDEKLYAYKQKFEGRIISVFNLKTGELIENEIPTIEEINKLRESNEEIRNDMFFPEIGNFPKEFKFLINNIENNNYEWLKFKNLLFYSILEKENEEPGKITMNCLEINSGKVIFTLGIIEKSNFFIPDTFFIVSNYLITIINKKILSVYKLQC